MDLWRLKGKLGVPGAEALRESCRARGDLKTEFGVRGLLCLVGHSNGLSGSGCRVCVLRGCGARQIRRAAFALGILSPETTVLKPLTVKLYGGQWPYVSSGGWADIKRSS